MTTQQLERQLENYKRGLILCAGVSAALMFLAVVDAPQRLSLAWGWYFLWAVFEIGTVPLGFWLLVGRNWREIPLEHRLNTAFGSLGLGWLLFFSFLIKSNKDESSAYGGLVTLLLYAPVVGAAAAIGLSYSMLRRMHSNANEEMFP